MPQNTITNDGILRDARDRYARREESGAHGAFEAEAKRAGAAPRAEVTVGRDTAPGRINEILGVPAGETVVVRSRKMFSGDKLVQLCDTYIPNFVAEAAPQVAELDTGVGGIISRMNDAGLTQVDVVEDVTLKIANLTEAELLGVEAGEKIIELTHTARTDDGRVVEVSVHVLGPGWTLRYGVPLS